MAWEGAVEDMLWSKHLLCSCDDGELILVIQVTLPISFF